jgi:LPS sulfotransferase NodH
MNVRSRVILLFEGRTGSSLLGNLLNQNKSISFLGEEVADLYENGWRSQLDWIDRLFFHVEQFQEKYQDPRIQDKSTVLGFKVKLRDIASEESFKRYIEDNNLTIIYMFRRNFVKQAVSSIRAIDLYKQTGFYNLSKKQANLTLGSYKISIRRFNTMLLQLLEVEHRLQVFLAELEVPIIRIAYEDMCQKPQKILDQIFEHLGVSSCQVTPNLLKLTSEDLSLVITNLDELINFYSDTPYGWMFKSE